MVGEGGGEGGRAWALYLHSGLPLVVFIFWNNYGSLIISIPLSNGYEPRGFVIPTHGLEKSLEKGLQWKEGSCLPTSLQNENFNPIVSFTKNLNYGGIQGKIMWKLIERDMMFEKKYLEDVLSIRTSPIYMEKESSR